MSPSRSSRGSPTLVPNQSSTHCSHRRSGLSSREVDRRSGHLTEARHRRQLYGEEDRSCVCRSHSSLRNCMASRPHLQAAAASIAAWQTHGPHNHGDGWQSQLHSCHRYEQAEQVTTPQERRPTAIPYWQRFSSISMPLTCQPPSPESAICIRRRPSNHAC